MYAVQMKLSIENCILYLPRIFLYHNKISLFIQSMLIIFTKRYLYTPLSIDLATKWCSLLAEQWNLCTNRSYFNKNYKCVSVQFWLRYASLESESF